MIVSPMVEVEFHGRRHSSGSGVYSVMQPWQECHLFRICNRVAYWVGSVGLHIGKRIGSEMGENVISKKIQVAKVPNKAEEVLL